MTHARRYKVLWTLVAALVLSLIGIWVFVVPLFDAMIESRQEAIQQFHTLREYRAEQMGRLADWQAQSERIIRYRSNIETLLSEDQIVDFIKMLEASAKENQVAIEISSKNKGMIVTTPNKEVPPGITESAKNEAKTTSGGASTTVSSSEPASLTEKLPYQTYLPLTLTVAGSYASIVTFLHRIETLPYLLEVVSVTLRKPEERENGRRQDPGSGVNPFLLTPGQTAAEKTDVTSEETPLLGELEGAFDIVVYIKR